MLGRRMGPGFWNGNLGSRGWNWSSSVTTRNHDEEDYIGFTLTTHQHHLEKQFNGEVAPYQGGVSRRNQHDGLRPTD